MFVVGRGIAGDKSEPGRALIVPLRAAVDIARLIGSDLKIAGGGKFKRARRYRLEAVRIENESDKRVEAAAVGIFLESPEAGLVAQLADTEKVDRLEDSSAVVGVVAYRPASALGHPLEALIMH